MRRSLPSSPKRIKDACQQGDLTSHQFYFLHTPAAFPSSKPSPQSRRAIISDLGQCAKLCFNANHTHRGTATSWLEAHKSAATPLLDSSCHSAQPIYLFIIRRKDNTLKLSIWEDKMGTLPVHTSLLSAQTVLSLSLVDIKCCFRAVLMVVCEFVVVRDEV